MAKDSKNDEAWNKQIEYMTNEIRKKENKNHDLQQRIRKAVEYLEYQLSLLDTFKDEDIKAKMLGAMVLVILKGDDTND